LGHKFLNLITALPGIVLFFTHIHDSIILWDIILINVSGNYSNFYSNIN